MTSDRLSHCCSLILVLMVSGCFAYGNREKNVQRPASSAAASGRPSQTAIELTIQAADQSEVVYVENGSDGYSLEPLYDFLIQLRLHKLCKLLRQAQLEDILLDTGPLTIFAPTDGSFIFLPDGGTLEEIEGNPQLLREFLLHHIVAGAISSQQIQDELVVTSLQGSPLRFNIYGSGQVYTVSGAQILQIDLPFQLGVLHVIDHPLYPFAENNIIGHLQSTHTELYRLLLSTGLAEQLSGGTYTIFAPDDRAFSYLSRDFQNILSRNKTLAEKILLDHILPGSIYTRGILHGMQIESLGGAVHTFTESRGMTFVNGVPIVSTDVPVTNGVIHVINRFLLSEDIDNECNCKTTSSETHSRNRPGQDQSTGGQFGTRQPQRPGSSIGSTQPQRPTARQPVGPDSPYRGDKLQRPGSSINTNQGFTPGNRNQGPASPHTGSGRPGTTGISGPNARPLQRPSVTGQNQGPVSGPGSTYDTRQNQNHGNSFWIEQPGGHGSIIDTGIGQRPGQPETTNVNFGTEPTRKPANSFGTGYPHPSPRPGSPHRANQPRVPGNSLTTGQRPGSHSTKGQTQRPDVSLGNVGRPGSQISIPNAPGNTQNNKPVRVSLPPPPTRSPVPSRSQTARYQGNQPKTTLGLDSPSDNGNSINGAYRPTRAPSTRATQGPRYPVPDSNRKQSTFPGPIAPVRTTLTPRPWGNNRHPTQRTTRVPPTTHFPPAYPDVTEDLIVNAPEQELQPDQPHRKQPTTLRPHSQTPRRGTPQQPTRRTTRRPTFAQTHRPPPRVTVSGPGSRTVPPQQPNCRQPGDRISSSNRNLPPCSTLTTTDEPCQNLNQPFDPSDPRPACPGSDLNEECRHPLQPPNSNDRRPVCRISQRRPNCRKQNEPSDGRPLCPGSTKSCRRPEDAEDSTSRLPLCQEAFAVEGCKRQDDPYDLQDRRPECPPDDCRPPQEPLKHGDRRPLCTVNQEDSFRQHFISTTEKPEYTQQTRTGSRHPTQAPGRGQSKPNKVNRNGSGTRSPTWQRPQPQTLTTSRPQTINPGTTFDQPYDGDRNQPGAPPSQSRPTPPRGSHQPTTRRPSHQSGRPAAQNGRHPAAQNGRPHTTGQRPSQPGHQTAQSTPSRPSKPHTTQGGDDSTRTLLDIAQDPGLLIKGHPVKLTILLDLLERAELIHILEEEGPMTVFLPSDDAFKKLPRGVIDQLKENPQLLQEVLLYHFIGREVIPTVQQTSITVPTRQGMSLVVTMLKEGRLILIGGAKAVAVTRGSNGIFYVINEMLYPLPHEDIVSALKSRPDLTQVTALVEQSGLSDMLSGQNPFTIFAPTDTAFEELPQGTLEFLTQNSTAVQELILGHIVEGAHFGREFLAGGVFPNGRGGKLRFKVLSYGYTVNDANIKTPEIVTGTGVIHLVDQVLLEPGELQIVEPQHSQPAQDRPTGFGEVLRIHDSNTFDENYAEISELARGMGLNQFLLWITNTGLIEKVHDGGKYTILAPTDEAINSLPESMIQAIDSDPDQVRPLMKFHVIAQHIDLNKIRNEQSVPTLLQNKQIRFNVVQQGHEKVVTACGVPLSQAQGTGSIKLIPVNQALYPPTGTLSQVLDASPILQNFAKAIRNSHLTWMLTGQTSMTLFAPSDTAFEALSEEDKKNLIENRQAFTDLLKRHIVKGSIFSSGIYDGMQTRNEKKETVTFSVHNGGISINSIPISYSDVTATNGVIHVIDHFL